MSRQADKRAILYRMVMPDHVCPYGLKALDLLRRKGFAVDDRWLKTRAETDAFKAEHQVATTPQTFIGGARIGGYDDLRRFLGRTVRDPDAVSYRPVIAVFAVAALLALAASWASLGALLTVRAGIWFVAQALRDPGNLGTMLRTGDAVGAGGVILIDESVDPFSVESVRASMGAIFTQRVVRAGWAEFLVWLRAGAGQLVATTLRDAVDYRGAPYQAPTFLLIGNESHGLPENYEAAADLRVKIPMMGKADSLNAAIAAAVVAYEILNQRR